MTHSVLSCLNVHLQLKTRNFLKILFLQIAALCIYLNVPITRDFTITHTNTPLTEIVKTFSLLIRSPKNLTLCLKLSWKGTFCQTSTYT